MHNTIYQRFGIFRAVFLGVGLLAFFATSVRAEDVDEARIRRKMEQIMIESLDYRQANIVDVINDLNDISRDNDEDGSDPREKGINFLLNIGDNDDFWDVGSIDDIPLVTLKARYVSLRVALDMVMEMTGLEYRVNGNIVMISRTSSPSKSDIQDSGSNTGHPLLSVTSLKVVKMFDSKKVRDPAKWKWYCYERDKAVLSDRPVETTKLGLKREPKDGPVVLLFDSSSETLYWKWRATPPARLFADKNAVNLATICFGPDPFVENLWIKHNPDWDHRYRISSRLLSDEVFGGDITRLEKAMEWIQDNWAYQQMPEWIQLDTTFTAQTNQLDKIIARIRRTNSGPQLRVLQQQRKELYDQTMVTADKMDKFKERFFKAMDKNPLEAAVRKMEFTVSVVMKGEERK